VKILETNAKKEVSGQNVRPAISRFLPSVISNISTDRLLEFKYFLFCSTLYKASGFMKLIDICQLA
jgi:hypothetical protein